MKLLRKVGSTSNILQIFVADSSSTTGAGLTGLTSGSAGLTAYYHRDTDTTATAISLVTMTVGTFTSSGFKEIDSTNMPGWYQFCPPNTAFATGASSVAFHLKGATNMAPLPIEVDLDGQVDVTHWNGTAVATPATAGIPEVNVKNINNVATTSVTAVNANVGTTQPVNFTGTGASALVKGDTVDIAGAAVSTASAQIGVNVVSYASGQSPLQPTVAGRTLDVSVTGEAGLDWANIGSPTTAVALTATTIATTQKVDVDTIKTNPVANAGTVTFPTNATLASTTNITAGTITTATNVTTVNGLAANVITAAAVADGAIDRATFAADTGLQTIRSNTAQAGAAGTITLDASASATTDYYADTLVYLTGGTGVGQVRRIRAYNGTTKVATVVPNWTTTPDATSTFAILPATSVWDETTADHLDSGSTGNSLNSAGSAGDPWSTAVPGAYGAGTAGYILGTNLDAAISTRAAAATALSTATWTNTRAGKLDYLDAAISSRLYPMTPGNEAVYVGGTGAVGIDWGYVQNPGTAVNLINSVINITSSSSTEIANAVWDTNISLHQSPGTGGDYLYSLYTGAIALSSGQVVDATPTATSFKTNLSAYATGFWDDMLLVFTSGSLWGQTKPITAFVSTNGQMSFDEGFTSAPANGDTFHILTGHVHPVTQIAGAVWDDSLPGTHAAGSAGYILGTNLDGVVSTIQSDTNDIQTRLPAALVSGRMDSSVGAMAADVITSSALATSAVTEIQTGLSTLTSAQVNTEVVDALATDTYAEPTGAPAATATLAQKINFLYEVLRNKLTVTATDKTFYNDSGTAQWSKALSDDGTTYTEAEGA